jgi:death-on-curing protein
VTVYLSLEDLLTIADMLGEPAVRDVGLLEAAAHRPAATAFGEDAYPNRHTKAAAMLESLVRNHALVDGNKRLGWVATVVYYRLNGQRLTAPEDEAYDLVLAIAAGQYDIAERLATWTT